MEICEAVVRTDSGLGLSCHLDPNHAGPHCCFDERMPPTAGWEYHFKPKGFFMTDKSACWVAQTDAF